MSYEEKILMEELHERQVIEARDNMFSRLALHENDYKEALRAAELELVKVRATNEKADI